MNENLIDVSTEIYYLKMNNNPNIIIEEDKRIHTKFLKLAVPIKVDAYLCYYRTVGEAYNWFDRILMEKTALQKIINAPKTEVFSYKILGEEAGFVEFVREKEHTEILYFGLFPKFIGKGYGKQFLQEVIKKAWANNPKWIQLNTCKLDHPNALATYQKNGFVLDETRVETRKIKNNI